MDRVIDRSITATVRRAVSRAVDFVQERLIWFVSIGVAYVVGQQIATPNPRGIKVLVGAALLAVLLFAPSAFGLSFFILAFPFPAFTSYGSTNTFLVFLLGIFWMFRVTTGQLRIMGRTMLDVPIMLMALMLAVSLYNAPDPRWLREGVINLVFYLSAFGIMYLTYNLVQDRRDLERVTFALTITALLIFSTVVIEVFFPYATIIRGWIGVQYSYRTGDVRRMAGVVGGHDSLADVCVIMFPLVLFRLYRARTMTRRLLYITTLAMGIFSLMATANRGGLIGLAFCMGYLVLLTLKEFNVIRYGVIAICLIVLMPAFDYYISTFRGGDSMFRRFVETKIESNLVPDTRVEVWRIAWEAYTKHIFVGHGLYFDYKVIPQPHNGFLWSLITTGLLGTIPWVWILLTLVWATWKRLRGNMERGDFASGLLTVFHVQIMTFILVQLRTDYQRSPTYVYLVWIVFGLALVAMRILDAERRAARAQA